MDDASPESKSKPNLDLEPLLTTLRKHGVLKFSYGALAIELEPAASLPLPAMEQPLPDYRDPARGFTPPRS